MVKRRPYLLKDLRLIVWDIETHQRHLASNDQRHDSQRERHLPAHKMLKHTLPTYLMTKTTNTVYSPVRR